MIKIRPLFRRYMQSMLRQLGQPGKRSNRRGDLHHPRNAPHNLQLQANSRDMTTKQDEDRARMESEANFLLRQNGFDSSGKPTPGKVGEERRRGAAIRLGHNPHYFEEYTDSPRDD